MWVWVSMYVNVLICAGGSLVVVLLGSKRLPDRPAVELSGLMRRFSQLTVAIVGVAMVSWVLFADRAGNAEPELLWRMMQPGEPLAIYGTLVIALMTFGMGGIALAAAFELMPSRFELTRRAIAQANILSSLVTMALFPMVPIYIAAVGDLRPPS